MPITFTAGYIEVWRDGVLISRHRVEREAVESCSKRGAGRYEIRYPVVRVDITDQLVGTLNISATCN